MSDQIAAITRGILEYQEELRARIKMLPFCNESYDKLTATKRVLEIIRSVDGGDA